MKADSSGPVHACQRDGVPRSDGEGSDGTEGWSTLEMTTAAVAAYPSGQSGGPG